jgi:hypothetical protein
MKTRSLPLKKILFAAVAILALLLAVVSSAKPEAPKTSAELHGLNFPHQFHVKDQDLGCDACHPKAAASVSGADDLLPGHPQCTECHDVSDTKNCGMCHKGEPKAGPRIAKYSPLFSHQRHLTQGKVECVACHADLDKPLAENKPAHVPAMVECLGCHNDRGVKNECNTCHEQPRAELVPPNHKLMGINDHGMQAAADQQACYVCHQTDDCQRCHNGDPIFNPHPRNYVYRHGQDARLSDLSCTTCHDREEDCNACHRQQGLIPIDHFQPGWVSAGEGGKHSDQASFDLESCLACHDQQQPVCARCHHK